MKFRRRFAGLIVAAAALVVCLAVSACAEPPRRTGQSPVEALGGRQAEPAAGFARAIEPRTFEFPADHGPHDEFQTEWWYFTGHLEAEDGSLFGFQWTVFRRGLVPPLESSEQARSSAWATRQVYFGHFALSDVANQRFHSFERFSRAAAGLSGAQAAPFRAWLEDWRAESRTADLWPLRLQARQDGVEIDLEIDAGKPLVLQGDAGLSRKNQQEGGASYYYSFTRLQASGRVTTPEDSHKVSGSAWLDREWSTSVLAPEQSGWDWFSLQLDGTGEGGEQEVMVYQLRLDDGSQDPASAGIVVAADGSHQRLSARDFIIEVQDHWRSPRSGARYPSRWRLRLPAHGLDLLVEPMLADQELDVSLRYWEGLVQVTGKNAAGTPIRGRGYVEMVGYDEP